MNRPLFYLIVVALLVAVFLTGCSGDESSLPEGEQTPMPVEDGQSTPASENPYPEPGEERPVEQGGEPYPEPDVPAVPESVPPPTDHEYAPKPEDADLDRGNVFIDSTEILLLESYPVQVNLVLMGNLPTPCHQLRAIASPPNAENHIEVEVYSLVDADLVCTQVLDPFEASIPLGAYTQGSYSVCVNGEDAGTFNLP